MRYGADRRALRAFDERHELVKAGVTRRDLMKMGLMTGAGVGGGMCSRTRASPPVGVDRARWARSRRWRRSYSRWWCCRRCPSANVDELSPTPTLAPTGRRTRQPACRSRAAPSPISPRSASRSSRTARPTWAPIPERAGPSRPAGADGVGIQHGRSGPERRPAGVAGAGPDAATPRVDTRASPQRAPASQGRTGVSASPRSRRICTTSTPRPTATAGRATRSSSGSSSAASTTTTSTTCASPGGTRRTRRTGTSRRRSASCGTTTIASTTRRRTPTRASSVRRSRSTHTTPATRSTGSTCRASRITTSRSCSPTGSSTRARACWRSTRSTPTESSATCSWSTARCSRSSRCPSAATASAFSIRARRASTRSS